MASHRLRSLSLAAFAAVIVGTCAAGCAYQYDDGLPPLGQRDAAVSASAQASASAASGAAAAQAESRRRSQQGAAGRVPLDQVLAGPTLQAWAQTVLPDEAGLSLGFDTGAVWPGRPSPTMSVDAAPGASELHFACRGPGMAAVRVDAGGEVLLSLSFACNRAWSRPVDIPAAGHLEVAFSAPGDAASNVAYRLTRP